MTVEERAKETYPKGVGIFTPEGAELLQKAYIRGAIEQKKIDIDKVCIILEKKFTDWIMTLDNLKPGCKEFIDVKDCISEFCKVMEE